MRGSRHSVLSIMWLSLDVGLCAVKLKPIGLVFLSTKAVHPQVPQMISYLFSGQEEAKKRCRGRAASQLERIRPDRPRGVDRMAAERAKGRTCGKVDLSGKG
jgi:hypothetical protein